MFNPSNKIIIVDDIEDELIGLAKVFLNNGVSCRTILYNVSIESLALNGVRIAFFDIKVSGKSFDLNQDDFDYNKDKNLSAVFNDLAYAIQSCISKDNGPYALIFWSKNTKVIPNFIEYVNERYPELPSPIFIDAIDKTHFIGKTQTEFQEKFNQIFNNKSIKLLFDFENKCCDAASETVNELFKTIPNNKIGWGASKEFETDFDAIFSKIALKTSGFTHANENPDKAIAEALSPIMNYYLFKKIVNEGCWKLHLKKLSEKGLKYPESFNEGVLNSFFHIDESRLSKDIRGSVILIDKLNNDVLKSININNFDKWFNSLIPIKENKIKKDIRGRCKLIAIEISSSCDYANKKNRLNKYILGVKIPIINVKEDVDQSKRPASSYHVGDSNFKYKEEDFQIWINFNFVFGATIDDSRLGDILFVFKKEIMDMIGNRYANHISRIGIVSF